MENSTLLNNKINRLMEDLGSSMSKGEFTNTLIPSKLIELLNECVVILEKIPSDSEEYKFNVNIVVKMIGYSANSGIRNTGNSLALNIKLAGLKYGESLADEYRYLLNKINSIKIPEEVKLSLQNDFPLFYNVGNSQSNANSTTSNNSGCYIATMAYGDYNHPQVIVLRQFRDNILEQYILGRLFIKLYYYYSPKIVKRVQNKQVINDVTRNILNKFIKLIRNKL